MNRKGILFVAALLILTSLACSAGTIVENIFGSGGSIDQRIQAVEDELTLGDEGSDSCDPNWWSTDYWEINILPLLAESDAHCWDFSAYFNCVQDRAQAGDCPSEASNYCAPVYQLILNESTKGEIKIVDNQLYVRDDDNTFAISFSMSGGSVEGYLLVDFRTDYGDGDYCVVTQEKVFTGSYDPGSCTLTGTVTITETHDENRNDICWGDPYEKTENWSMIIQNGRLGPGGPYNQLVGETYPLINYVKLIQ